MACERSPRPRVNAMQPDEGIPNTIPESGIYTLSAPLPEEHFVGGKSQTTARVPNEGNAVGEFKTVGDGGKSHDVGTTGTEAAKAEVLGAEDNNDGGRCAQPEDKVRRTYQNFLIITPNAH